MSYVWAESLPAPQVRQCERFLTQKRVSYDEAAKRLKLTPENIEFLTKQRRNLQELKAKLSGRVQESEHAIRRVIEMLMLQTHGYLYGPPGGAKSQITRSILTVPMTQADGVTREPDVFSIQFNQLMSDAPFKGYIDFKSLKTSSIQEEQISNKGTMIHFKRAFGDELDKGNPIAFAAMLDTINEKIAQYGPVTVKVRTQTFTATSNMNVYELLEALSASGMESTARAFLDRLVFKIYVHNYPSQASTRQRLMQSALDKRAKEARERLAEPEKEYASKQAQIMTPEDAGANLPEVDYVWLGDLATLGTRFTPGTVEATEVLVNELRMAYNAIRRRSEEERAKDMTGSKKPVYYPPFIFSMRNIMQYVPATIQASVVLDLMSLSEDVLPMADLVKLLEDGIPIDRLSIWRAQDVLTTAAPGDPSLKISNDGTVFDLVYGPELDTFLQSPFDSYEEALLRYIQEERMVVSRIYKQRTESALANTKQISDILSQSEALAALLKKKGMLNTQIRSIEEFLYHVNPSVANPAQTTP